MAESAVSGDVYLPVLAGGTLDRSPADGAVAQNVRGCSAIAIVVGAAQLWSITMERTDVPIESCVVLIGAGTIDALPTTVTVQYLWSAQGVLQILRSVSDGESGFELSLNEAISFAILLIPNR